MKKKYISPTSETINLIAEQMLALSVVTGETVDPNTSWSNKKSGWNSDDWSTSAADEE
ncbi:MAG: hypothetical protein Q4E59_03400 [Bacteroidales bacterium]|nr:hypothetical protein [Bacteroidales bacterium]